jgi:hypothetical protein
MQSKKLAMGIPELQCRWLQLPTPCFNASYATIREIRNGLDEIDLFCHAAIHL